MEGLSSRQLDAMLSKVYDGPSQLRRATIRQEINGSIKYLEEQLKVKKEMLELFDRNNDIEKFMDLSRS